MLTDGERIDAYFAAQGGCARPTDMLGTPELADLPEVRKSYDSAQELVRLACAATFQPDPSPEQIARVSARLKIPELSSGTPAP